MLRRQRRGGPPPASGIWAAPEGGGEKDGAEAERRVGVRWVDDDAEGERDWGRGEGGSVG